MEKSARDLRIESHLPLVHACAWKIHRETGLPVDDLAGAGMVGLTQAADAWARERGVAFGAYAKARIRGAMLDSIKRQQAFENCCVALPLAPIPDHQASPEQSAAVMIDAGRLKRALEALNPGERELVTCECVAGASRAETARRMGISKREGARLRNRGIQKLRRAVGQMSVMAVAAALS